MKIKNLILKVKLKQIETQHKYIFVFHCSSLNELQWRHCKYLFYMTQGNTLFQPSALQEKPRAIKSEAKVEKRSGCLRSEAEGSTVSLASYKRTQVLRRLLAYNNSSQVKDPQLKNRSAFEASESLEKVWQAYEKRRKRSSLLSAADAVAKIPLNVDNYKGSLVQETKSLSTKVLQQNRADLCFALRLASDSQSLVLPNTKLTTTPGPLCIVYFFEKTKRTNSGELLWSDLLNKIAFLESTGNLVLLYAQFNLNKYNHVDVKQAMTLNKNTVFELFLQFLNYPTTLVDRCLHFNTTQFFCIQGAIEKTGTLCEGCNKAEKRGGG